MVGLPATGTLSYNGYVFDGATNIVCDVLFVYDDSGRTVIAHKHVIEVVAIVHDEDGLDSDLLDIRQRLGKGGQLLTFTGKGFGDLVVAGTPGSAKVVDINNGPSPRVLRWTPLGDNKAAEVRWIVETTVPICKPAAQKLGIAAYNYGVEFDINKHGDTVRTINGYFQIVSTTADGKQFQSPDAFRERFQPAILEGFHREQTWTINALRSRCEFSIVDTEIATSNPYPNAIVEISGTHRYSHRRGLGRDASFTRDNVISMRITPRPGTSGKYAYRVFMLAVKRRTDYARSKGLGMRWTGFDVEEDLFGRTHTFSFSYRILSTLETHVERLGFWRPVEANGGWKRWVRSLSNTAFHPRGAVKLKDLAKDDVVVSLCDPLDSVTQPSTDDTGDPPSGGGGGGGGGGGDQPSAGDDPPLIGGGILEKPKKVASYESVQMHVITRREQPVVRHKVLQTPLAADSNFWPIGLNQPVKTVKGTPECIFSWESGVSASPSAGSEGVIPDIIQVGSSPSHSLRFAGRIRRVGFPITRPAIVQVGKVPVVEVKAEFDLSVIDSDAGGVPTYQATWVIDYILPSTPGAVGVPDIIE